MAIWIAVAAVAAVGAVTTGIIMSEAAKETAKTNAEAQKYTAEQARIAQVESSKQQAQAEMHGYDTDKEIEQRIMAQEDKEFESNLEQDKEIALAQNSLFELQYAVDPMQGGDRAGSSALELGQSYDYGYDAEGDPVLS